MSFHTPQHRRDILRLGLTVSGGVLLSGCGGGGSGKAASDAVVVVPAPVTPAMPAGAGGGSGGGHVLNVALMLAYVGAQYHGYAARGVGLPAALTGGIGTPGAVSGARQASFGDLVVADHAAELADDRRAHVAALRERLGAEAAAQPAIDLSPGGAFARAAQQVGAGGAFDPYASDDGYLIGAFFIENAVAAAYRTLLDANADAGAASLIAEHLADAIYHGGLIRSLIDQRAAANPDMGRMMTVAAEDLTVLDGTAAGGEAVIAANIADVQGRPIPFTRDARQILQTLTLSTTGTGGFLPNGANGLPV